VLTDDLLALQHADTTIDQLTNRRVALPERAALTAAQGDLARSQKAVAAIIARQRELTDSVEASEHHGAELTKKRTRLEAQLKTVIAPREAEALMQELATLAAERDAIDDAELEALEEQSQLVDDLAAAHAAEPALARAMESATAALAAVEAEIDSEIGALTISRAEIASRLHGGVLADYEQRRRHHGGVAVAHLEGRTCSGCHLDLSTSEFEQVRATPPGELAECPQCGRILVP
jgi:predicted  nucleic acid-binding Zn-ribbon protein